MRKINNLKRKKCEAKIQQPRRIESTNSGRLAQYICMSNQTKVPELKNNADCIYRRLKEK